MARERVQLAWWLRRWAGGAVSALLALVLAHCAIQLDPVACLADPDCPNATERCIAGRCQVTTDPFIAITSPQSGVLNSNSAIIHVDVRNFTLDPAAIGGEPVAGHGHWHIFLNGDYLGASGETDFALARLPMQSNTVRVVLAENDHSELPYEDEVVLDVRPESRALVITIPAVPLVSKLDVTVGTTVPISVHIDHFELDPNHVGAPADPCLCRGHMHLYVSDPLVPGSRAWQGAQPLATFDVDPAQLLLQDGSSLAAGTTYLFEVWLAENDHVEIDPPVFDYFRFELVEPEGTGTGGGAQ